MLDIPKHKLEIIKNKNPIEVMPNPITEVITDIFSKDTGRIYVNSDARRCNLNCSFCIGKHVDDALGELSLRKELKNIDALKVPYKLWPNFQAYLDFCEKKGIKKLILTSINTDPAMKDDITELVDYLKARKFKVGLTTNGKAYSKNTIKRFDGPVSFSIQSLKPSTSLKLVGTDQLPDWRKVIPENEKVRISTVVTPDNKDEILFNAKTLSQYPNVKYYQVRSDCNPQSDNTVFYELLDQASKEFPKLPLPFPVEGISAYKIHGTNVIFSDTQKVEAPSVSYLTNGIVIHNKETQGLSPSVSIMDKLFDKYPAVRNFIKANW